MVSFYKLIMFSTITDVNHYSNVQKLYEIVIFLRLLKFFDLLYEIKTLRIIMETLRNLARPLSDVAGILFVIYYFFGQIGIYIFGGYNTLGNAVVDNDPAVP